MYTDKSFIPRPLLSIIMASSDSSTSPERQPSGTVPQELNLPISPPKKSSKKPSNPQAKRRRAITNEERRIVRKKHTDEPSLTYERLSIWFADEYYHKLAVSTIGEILSSKYDHLDGFRDHKDDKRVSSAHWPDLESALHEFELRIILKGGTVTGDILKEFASRLWRKMPQYQLQEEPKWSEGWLDAFKRRYNVKRRRRHGEKASVNIQEVELELSDLREIIIQYPTKDVFNMDETGLFWKISPEYSLGSIATPGAKLEKARITANFCCNGDGSELLSPWFIGHANNPRCFKNINIDNLDLVWRANKKAWMNGQIFREYLLWFARYIGNVNRNVLLLIDGFSAHVAGLALYEASVYKAPNIRIEFLPANATAYCQPLDQGIIRAFKVHYRRRWLQFAVDCYENDKNPAKEINMLTALRWSLAAWREGVTPLTVQRCWLKSRIFSAKYGPETKLEAERGGWKEELRLDEDAQIEIVAELRDTLKSLEDQGRIQKVMDISMFLNPVEERVDDSEEDLLEMLASMYSHSEHDQEEDGTAVVAPKVTIIEALEALATLRLYEEQRDDDQVEVLRRLRALEKDIQGRRHTETTQSLITSYFT
jgi:hypothetical protein